MFDLLRRWFKGSSRVRQIKVRKHQFRPRLEFLEDRLAPAVFNVNSTADVLNPPTGVVTLRSAVEAANATPGGNTINLTVAGDYKITLPGAPGEIDNAAGEFAVAASGGNLTIQNPSGGAVTVDGNHLSRVFDVNPIFTIGSAVVTDGGQGFSSAPKVTLIGGGTGADAAAILASPKIAVTFIGFTIANGVANGGNVPAGAGGGIRDNDNASLTLTNMVVTDNFASADGGGIANSGNGVVNIASSTIADNFAGTTGGGFSDENNQGTLNVVNSLFLNNAAAGNGGGIFVGSPNTTITSTQIEGNSSGGSGGGIFAGGVKLTVQDSIIADNFTSGNGAGLEIATSGGGLANGSIVANSTITGNIALNRTVATTGGGIDASAAFTGELLLLNDTINGNSAASGGGASAANTAGAAVIAENTIIAGNFLDNAGAGTDASGAFIDLGGNLIGVSGAGSGNTGFTASTTQSGTLANPLNPLLGPLENNGGPTVGAAGDSMTLQTEALQVGSKAVDKGVAGAPTVDERGFVREDAATGAAPDVGAFEFENSSLSVSVAPSAAMVAVNGGVTFKITVANSSANALPDDDSLVTVTLPPNLTLTASPAGSTVSGNTVTFRLGGVAANGNVMFTLTVKANATGTATVGASVTSPDANPNTASNTGSVTVTDKLKPSPPYVPEKPSSHTRNRSR